MAMGRAIALLASGILLPGCGLLAALVQGADGANPLVIDTAVPDAARADRPSTDLLPTDRLVHDAAQPDLPPRDGTVGDAARDGAASDAMAAERPVDAAMCPGNQPPLVLGLPSFPATMNVPLRIAAGQVATDPDGDPLRFISVRDQSGSALRLPADGSHFVYPAPVVPDAGTMTLSATVSDGCDQIQVAIEVILRHARDCAVLRNGWQDVASGSYLLDSNQGPYVAYCTMDRSMAGGGWTLGFIVDGTTAVGQYLYDDPIWTSMTGTDDDPELLTVRDAKFMAATRAPVDELLVEFVDHNMERRMLRLGVAGPNLVSLLGREERTHQTRSAWLGLLPGGLSLAPLGCWREGVNTALACSVSASPVPIRIGLLGGSDNDNGIVFTLGLGTPTMKAGYGAPGDETGMVALLHARSSDFRLFEPEVSCQGHLQAGRTLDGYYLADADADGPGQPETVYCNMQLDSGGYQLIGRSAPPGAAPFGWLVDQGSATATARHFSYDARRISGTIAHLLVADRGSGNIVAENVYRSGLPADFLTGYLAVEYDADPAEVIAGPCVGGQVPRMLGHLGYTAASDLYYLRDVDETGTMEHFGLTPTGFRLAGSGCDWDGGLDGRHGLLFVR